MRHMDRAAFDGIELEYERRGVGEHVVFVHHGIGADWFNPLFEESALAGRYALVRYHRLGYAGSSRLPAVLTFQDEAIRFRGLMRHLGIERAHLVGHSASGCIALQIAADAADIVHSLAVLEPALMTVPSPPEVANALERYRAGDIRGAVETFLRGTCGIDAGTVVEQRVPGAMEQAIADAHAFFGGELPALRRWSFGPAEASAITQPVLAVLGEHSDPRFHERQKLLLEWLPEVEPFVLKDAGHLLHLDNAAGLAEELASFFARHSIKP